MGWFDSANKKEIQKLRTELDSTKQAVIDASFSMGTFKPLFHVSYDGEKNMGELGTLTKYHLDYEGLRLRSWESYLVSDPTQTILKKFALWIIGGGLKLQSEPAESILQEEGVSLDVSKFAKSVEGRFKLYSASRKSDYSRLNNLDRIAKTAYLNSIIGGDVLVVLRVEDGQLNVQLIDGGHVKTPNFSKHEAEAKDRGNKIKNGIETNARGEHINYFVQTRFDDVQVIPAKGEKSGKEMAFLVYGLEYRIDDNRGIPLISAVLETLKKLDRYKEATVGSAEERAKIPYVIEHTDNSTGENPFVKVLAKAQNVDSKQEVPIDINGKQLADLVAVSTNKTVVNMPNGASLKALDSKNDIYFKDFYGVNIEAICATIGIPPEVALSKYDSNFSASRAALKDWEHTIRVERKNFTFQFYQKIYNFWLELEILKGTIQAPGYTSAVAKNDELLLDAFRKARFVGSNVPHIDPLKEAQAERLKLGAAGAHLPLTTLADATEALNGGESSMNIIKYAKELDEAEEAGIEQVAAPGAAPIDESNKKEE